MKQLDYQELNDTSLYAIASLTVAHLLKNHTWIWLHMRSDFLPFASKNRNVQVGNSTFDNSLTCYCKSNQTIADELGIAEKTFRRAKVEMQEAGCLFQIPFQDNQTNAYRKAMIPLDPESSSYHDTLLQLKEKLDYRIQMADHDRPEIKKEREFVEKFIQHPPFDYSKMIRQVHEFDKDAPPY